MRRCLPFDILSSRQHIELNIFCLQGHVRSIQASRRLHRSLCDGNVDFRPAHSQTYAYQSREHSLYILPCLKVWWNWVVIKWVSKYVTGQKVIWLESSFWVIVTIKTIVYYRHHLTWLYDSLHNAITNSGMGNPQVPDAENNANY